MAASGNMTLANREPGSTTSDQHKALEAVLNAHGASSGLKDKARKQDQSWRRAVSKANGLLEESGAVSSSMMLDLDRKTLNLLQTLCRIQAQRGHPGAAEPELALAAG